MIKKPCRIQQSLFGHDYNAIIKKAKAVKTMGGATVQQVALNHGIYVSFLKILEQAEQHLILQGGLVTFKILKRTRK